MDIQTPIRPFKVVVLSLLMLVGPVALAGESGQERALAVSHEDSGLKWGPCPALFPEGCEIAVLHGDPAKANTDIFFKVPGGYNIPRHWHTSAERMVLVSGQLEVIYEGQDPEVLKPGNYAYGPPERPHEGFCAEGDPCVLFIAFEEPIDAHPADSGSR